MIRAIHLRDPTRRVLKSYCGVTEGYTASSIQESLAETTCRNCLRHYNHRENKTESGS